MKAKDYVKEFIRHTRKYVDLLNLNVSTDRDCIHCNNTGLMRYKGSPSQSLMGPCEYCHRGTEDGKGE